MDVFGWFFYILRNLPNMTYSFRASELLQIAIHSDRFINNLTILLPVWSFYPFLKSTWSFRPFLSIWNLWRFFMSYQWAFSWQLQTYVIHFVIFKFLSFFLPSSSCWAFSIQIKVFMVYFVNVKPLSFFNQLEAIELFLVRLIFLKFYCQTNIILSFFLTVLRLCAAFCQIFLPDSNLLSFSCSIQAFKIFLFKLKLIFFFQSNRSLWALSSQHQFFKL